MKIASDMTSNMVDNVQIAVNDMISNLISFTRKNQTITWICCAGTAAYFTLRGPVGRYLQREFAHAYANDYLPNMDKMLHDFRSTIVAYLDDHRENSANSEELQLLEVGIGPGSSLKYYDGKAVKVIGLEPNPYFVGILAKKRNEFPFLSVVSGRCEDLSEFRDESIDIVVSSMVLCSVSDLCKSIREIRRVLKKGGRYYFYEHQASPDSWTLYIYQLLYTPLFMVTMDGCRPSRSIYGAIRKNGGFNMTCACQEDGPKPSIFKPITHGYAVKK